jgi:hypothetical protein
VTGATTTVKRIALAATIGALATACSTVPTAPTLTALPGSTRSLEQFRADDARCQLDARAGLGVPPGSTFTGLSYDEARWRYDRAYVQCMYAAGHKVPVWTRGEEAGAGAAGAPPAAGAAPAGAPPPGAPSPGALPPGALPPGALPPGVPPPPPGAPPPPPPTWRTR